MSHTNVLLGEMIDTSIREDRVVRAPYSEGLAADLYEACEGEAEVDSEHEYWGLCGAYSWRIHLTGVVCK